MKSFRTFIKEETTPTSGVTRGVIDVRNPEVRATINAALAAGFGQGAIGSPLQALNVARKILANYHIFIPNSNPPASNRGTLVFPADQFGAKVGMNDDGRVVSVEEAPYSIVLKYNVVFGRFWATCEIAENGSINESVEYEEKKTDELNEISKETKKSYLNKADDNWMDMWRNGTIKKIEKRRKAMQKASIDVNGEKRFADYDPKTGQYSTKVNEDQLTELSIEKLKDYKHAATLDQQLANRHGALRGNPKQFARWKKRDAGKEAAATKIKQKQAARKTDDSAPSWAQIPKNYRPTIKEQETINEIDMNAMEKKVGQSSNVVDKRGEGSASQYAAYSTVDRTKTALDKAQPYKNSKMAIRYPKSNPDNLNKMGPVK